MFVLVWHGERHIIPGQLQSPIWHIYYSPSMFSCGFQLAPSSQFLEPLLHTRQSPKILDSNKKKPKVSGISYEADLIKNEDKDNVKCYAPQQLPKSTEILVAKPRESSVTQQLCGSRVMSYSTFNQYLIANWEALSLQTHISSLSLLLNIRVIIVSPHWLLVLVKYSHFNPPSLCS